jgi:diketogulonate reductase-like aldo/keto reductase
MEMPLFGIGTYTITGEKCSDIIFEGLKLGYKLIDTAELYDNHKDIASAISTAQQHNIATREDIWISSKIHNRDQRRLEIASAVQKILSDLNTNYIDLVMLHSAQKTYVSAYKELLTIKNYFNIRNIGVSNFRQDELEAIIKHTSITPYINQVEISPFNQRLQLREYMKKNNILTQAYGSLVCGKMFDSEYLQHDSNTPDQLLLGWGKHYNIRPIPTSHNITELQINYNNLQNVNLNIQTIQQLDSIDEYVCNYKHHADKLI